MKSSTAIRSACASSQRTGESAVAASTGRRAAGIRPVGGPTASRSTTSRAASGARPSNSASWAGSSSRLAIASTAAAAAPMLNVGSPTSVRPRSAIRPASWLRETCSSSVRAGGPRAAGAGIRSRTTGSSLSWSSRPQTTTASRNRSSAGASCCGVTSSSLATASVSVGSGDNTIASTTCRAPTSNRSSAISTDARPAARVASTSMSDGTGCSRSGRAMSSRARSSSGCSRNQLTRSSWAVLIRSTLLGASLLPRCREQ